MAAPGRARATLRPGARRMRAGKRPHQLIECLGRAPVFLALVGRQFERDDRHRQAERARQAAGIVLDQFRGAGGADQHRLRLEPLIRVARRGLEQFGGIAAEIARLEGRVGHRAAASPPLDHGEQQVGVGVALRRMQHVMHALHRGRDAHRADMGRAFIGPERELHRERSDRQPRAAARAGGRTVRRDRPPGRSPGSA